MEWVEFIRNGKRVIRKYKVGSRWYRIEIKSGKEIIKKYKMVSRVVDKVIKRW